MLISIETHRTYDFRGVILLRWEHQSFGRNIASVANCSSKQIIYAQGTFLKKLLLVTKKKNPLPELETSHVLLKTLLNLGSSSLL